MTISELIQELKEIKEDHGDLPIYIDLLDLVEYPFEMKLVHIGILESIETKIDGKLPLRVIFV